MKKKINLKNLKQIKKILPIKKKKIPLVKVARKNNNSRDLSSSATKLGPNSN